MKRRGSVFVGAGFCLMLRFVSGVLADEHVPGPSVQVQPSLIELMHSTAYKFMAKDTTHGTPEMLKNAGFNRAVLYQWAADSGDTFFFNDMKVMRYVDPPYDAGRLADRSDSTTFPCQTQIINGGLSGPLMQGFADTCTFIVNREGLRGLTGLLWDVEFRPFPVYRFYDSECWKNRILCWCSICIAEYNSQYGHTVDTLNPDLAIGWIEFNGPHLDQSQTSEADSAKFGKDSTSVTIAQTFKPDSCLISKIEVRVRPADTLSGAWKKGPAIRAELRTTKPDGTPQDALDMFFIDGRKAYWAIRAHCTTEDSFVTLKFYFDCELDTCQTYAVVFSYDGGPLVDSTKGYWLKYDPGDATDPYPDGQALRYDPRATPQWQPVSGDLYFKTYYPSQRPDSLREDWIDFKCNQIATIGGMYREKVRDAVGKTEIVDISVPIEPLRSDTLAYSDQYDKLAQSFRPNYDQLCTVTIEARKIGSPDGGFYASIQEMIWDPVLDYAYPSGMPLVSSYYVPPDSVGAEFDTLYLPMDSFQLDLDRKYALVLDFAGSYSDANYFLVAGNKVEYNVGSCLRGSSADQWYDTNRDIGFSVEYLGHPKLYVYSGDSTGASYNQTIKERYSCDWNLMRDKIDAAIVGSWNGSFGNTRQKLGEVPIVGDLPSASYKQHCHDSVYICSTTVARGDSSDWYGLHYWQGYGPDWGFWHPDSDNATIFRGIKGASAWMVDHEDSLRPATYLFAPRYSDSPKATAYSGARKLVMTSDDVFHRVYQGNGHVLYARSTDGGDSWLGPWDFRPGTYPCIAKTASDDLCLVWLCGEEQIYYARWAPLTGWSEPWSLLALAGFGSLHILPLSLAVDSQTTGHLAWEVIAEPEVYPGYVTYELHCSTFDADTTQPELSDAVLDTASEYVSSWQEVEEALGSASIALDSLKSPCIAWSRPIGSGKHNIYYMGYGSQGWPNDPDTVFACSTHSFHPNISYNCYSDAIDVVWEEEQPDSMFEILHRRRKTAQWGPVSPPSGGKSGDNSRFPFMDGDYCGWAQSFPCSAITEIYYSALASSAPVYWTPPKNFSQTAYDSSAYPHFIHESGVLQPRLHGIWTDGNSPGPYEVKFNSVIVPYDFSGHITQDTTWSHDIIITGDVWVDYGVTLTIEQGVKVLFAPHMDDQHSGVDTGRSELIIEGALKTLGAEADSIEFISLGGSPMPGDWYGLRYPGQEDPGDGKGRGDELQVRAVPDLFRQTQDLKQSRETQQFSIWQSQRFGSDANYSSPGPVPRSPTDSEGSDLSSPGVDRTGQDGTFSPSSGTETDSNGLTPDKPSLQEPKENLPSGEPKPLGGGGQEINYCRIEHAERGIWVEDDRVSEIKTSIISNCADAGIRLVDSHPEIKQNAIASNGTGIYCGEESSPVVKEDRILENSSYGVYICDEAEPNLGDENEVGHNYVYGSGEYDVYNNTSNDIKAENNHWGTMDPDSIAAHIWDYYDDPSLGIVDFEPFWEGEGKGDRGAQSAEERLLVPRAFALSQNHPNPCTELTAINYQLPKPSQTSLRVYDMTGRLVRVLADEKKKAGYYSVRWDGRSSSGDELASGVYFYRLAVYPEQRPGAGDPALSEVEVFTVTKKIVLLK